MGDELNPVEMTEDATPNAEPPPVRTPAKPAAPANRGIPATQRPIPEDPEELREELKRTRQALESRNSEAARQRIRLDELERAEEERQNGQLSEMEKARKELTESQRRTQDAVHRAEAAEAQAVELRITHAVERQAAAMGFEYPDITPQLIERRLVSYDPETNKVTGAKEALERLLKDRPGLAKASPRGGTPPRDVVLRGGLAAHQREQEVRPLTPKEDLLAQGGY